MKQTFTYKGIGRIYIDKEENIEKVKEEIMEMDEFEYDYLPTAFIALFDYYPVTVFVGKFEIDINELTARCWKKGIHIFCYDAGLM